MNKPDFRRILAILFTILAIFLFTGQYAWFMLTATFALILFFWNMSHEHEIRSLKAENDRKILLLEKKLASASTVKPIQAIMESNARFAGGIAHDLNNVLSGLTTYPELILMDLPGDSPLRKPLNTIMKSGKRAADIVSDLVTISKGISSDKRVLNINTVIKSFFSSEPYRELISKSSGITISVDLEPDLLNAVGSYIYIITIVKNLLVNGLESVMGEGTVQITTRNLYLDEPDPDLTDLPKGEYVRLSISDTGLHIPRKDLERIFEPYYCKKVMERSCSGLGLAIVWNMVRDSHGSIYAKSSDKGSVFDVYFPASRNNLDQSSESMDDIQDLNGNGESVLIVDDDELQREIAENILTHAGYTVRTVPSGETALEYLKTHKADLIVLDMIMTPGINGYETYRRISAFLPGQKAVIASGFVKSSDVEKAQNLGAGRYVRKPYMVTDLLRAVKAELGNDTNQQT